VSSKTLKSSRSYSSSSDEGSDGDESHTYTDAQFGVTTTTSKGSYMSDDDESVYSRLSQDSFSIDDDDLDTTQ
jgi:hypothetical protein